MNPVRHHPWVIMYLFGTVAGFAGALWTGLEGWWLPFGFLAYGLAVSVTGILVWLHVTGQRVPRLRDCLTLVKTIRKLRS